MLHKMWGTEKLLRYIVVNRQRHCSKGGYCNSSVHVRGKAKDYSLIATSGTWL